MESATILIYNTYTKCFPVVGVYSLLTLPIIRPSRIYFVAAKHVNVDGSDELSH